MELWVSLGMLEVVSLPLKGGGVAMTSSGLV